MQVRLIFHHFGSIIMFWGLVLLMPVLTAVIYGEQLWQIFLGMALGLISGGFLLFHFANPEKTITVREGFVVATAGFILSSLIGALVYYCTTSLTFVEGIFEAMSGVTTTGSTVIASIESMPRSVLVWRSATQWAGGMFVLIVSISLFPFIESGGMQLYQSTVGTKERMGSRMQATIKTLAIIYLSFSFLFAVILYFCGLNAFDAINHAMTVISTGGFSTRTESILAFQNPVLDWALAGMMIFAGVNFTLHFRALRGNWRAYGNSEEFIFYVITILFAFVTICFLVLNRFPHLEAAARHTIFQVASFISTTGYHTSHYELWPTYCKYLLLSLLFIGGCAGSAASGIKVVRFMLVFKNCLNQIYSLIHPKGVRVIKLDSKTLSDHAVQGVMGFFILNAGIVLIGTFVLSLSGIDKVTAASAVIANFFNFGPGLGAFGPYQNYSALSDFSKLGLAFTMMVGRLEIFIVLTCFFPSFWRD